MQLSVSFLLWSLWVCTASVCVCHRTSVYVNIVWDGIENVVHWLIRWMSWACYNFLFFTWICLNAGKTEHFRNEFCRACLNLLYFFYLCWNFNTWVLLIFKFVVYSDTQKFKKNLYSDTGSSVAIRYIVVLTWHFVVKKCTRVDGPWTRAMNSGSGNRALLVCMFWDWFIIHAHCWYLVAFQDSGAGPLLKLRTALCSLHRTGGHTGWQVMVIWEPEWPDLSGVIGPSVGDLSSGGVIGPSVGDQRSHIVSSGENEESYIPYCISQIQSDSVLHTFLHKSTPCVQHAYTLSNYTEPSSN